MLHVLGDLGTNTQVHKGKAHYIEVYSDSEPNEEVELDAC